jgi:uncharacterized LabA/DUF88 family protein
VLPAAPETATAEAEAVAEQVDAEAVTHPMPAVPTLPDTTIEGQSADEPLMMSGPAFLGPTAAPFDVVAAPAAEAAAPEAAPTSAPRNPYRFDRRRTPAPAQQATVKLRPERLSGRLAAESPATTSTAVEPPAPAPSPLDAAEAEARTEAQAGVQTGESAAIVPVKTGMASPEAGPPTAAETPGHESAPAASAEAQEDEAAEEGHEHAHRRRRRRRATSRQQGGEVAEAAAPSAPLAPEREAGNGFAGIYGVPFTELEESYPPYAPYTPGGRERAEREERSLPSQPSQPQPSPWTLAEAQQQINRPDSPFGAPEPSFARGFGPQPRGVAGPPREPYVRTRSDRGTDVPPISSNQLAGAITSAIQQQTDRLLTELRRQAAPPSMTVTLPAFPSTERVGVFVDVANLLYSARNLRLSLDFGRLLDFLRGSRRLIRAHAYAPTNPDPHAEQAFLSVVKGVGYRITTKNYKTFSSGAKKADLDLDMCMDIVRLVDAGAIDTLVLVSGDSDFLPLLEYCSDHGIRVEVAAFEDAAAGILRQSCDLFINLSMVGDIRA